jgi:transposase
MGWAYSVDLRERVVAAFDRTGMTDQEAAALFNVGEATVRRWKRPRRETGGLDPKKFGGGNPPRVAPEQYPVVRSIVDERPDLTDQEVAWDRRTGRPVSRSSMNRVLTSAQLADEEVPEAAVTPPLHPRSP